MTYGSLKRGRWEVKSCFPFFPFSNLFYFFILSNAKVSKKQICSGKGEKKMVDLGMREKIQMQMVEKKMG
jgi:hypothetical protein